MGMGSIDKHRRRNVSACVDEYGPVVGRGGVEAVVPLGGDAVSSASIEKVNQ